MQLPADFRPADFLAFHGRDSQQVAERVTGMRIQKGLVWRGYPACLTLDFTPGEAQVQLHVDGPAPDPAHLTALARHLLGVDQPVAELAAAHGHHPQLAPSSPASPACACPRPPRPLKPSAGPSPASRSAWPPR